MDQKQPLKRKGRTSTWMDCLFQQVSYSSRGGKAEIRGSIAKRQVDLEPTGGNQINTERLFSHFKGTTDKTQVSMGQKGKKNFLSIARRLAMICFHLCMGNDEGHGDKR